LLPGVEATILTVAKVVTPQKEALVFQKRISQPFKLVDLGQQFKVNPGACLDLSTNPDPMNASPAGFDKANLTSNLTAIRSRGYGNADGQTLTDGTYILPFNTFQVQSAPWDWTLSLKSSSTPVQISVRGLPTLSKLALDLKTTVDMTSADLMSDGTPVNFDFSKDVRLSWTFNNIPTVSYVSLIFRSPKKCLKCIQAAATGSLNISSSQWKIFDGESSFDLTAQLEAFSFYPESNFIVASYDWRSLHVNRGG
jgi:hypothetical protein